MSKSKKKDQKVVIIPKNNPVAKHMENFNRPNTQQDQKKEEKKNPSQIWDEQ